MDPFKAIDDSCLISISLLVCWEAEIACERPQLSKAPYIVMFTHVWRSNRARQLLTRSDLNDFLCDAFRISAKTAKVLVDYAICEGLLALEPDPIDRRKKHVVISQHLLMRLSSFSRRFLGETSEILAPASENPPDLDALLKSEGE